MTPQRLLIELLLFLTPFAIFYLYRAASRDLSVRDRWPMTVLVVAGGILAVGALIVAALMEPSDHGLCYQAPQYVDGVYIEGRKLPCDQVVTPHSEGATSAAEDRLPIAEPGGEDGDAPDDR